jgi:hypothetical protein
LQGDAVKGGRALQAPWPASDRQPSEAQVRRLQAKLKTLGYEVGDIDGKIGDTLRAAVRARSATVSRPWLPNLTLLELVSASRCLCPRDGLRPPSKEWRCGVSPALAPPATPRLGSASHF